MPAMTFKDPRGRSYPLGEPVGKGGEATVYRVAGKGDWLAKIYDAPTEEREQKLAWMIDNPPDDPAAKMDHISIAWPVRLLYREHSFAGYLMPHILDAVHLLNVFHPRLRLQTFQSFTRQHLHNTAYNLAAALGAIHDRGYVVGDLNESNVLVARSTLVTVIDTDSFQVHAQTAGGGRRTHLCTVAKPEYLPPEMQSKNLTKTVRLPEHDRFALTVLIYQLLMDGSHPFRARWKGSGEKPSLPERIRLGLFPHRGPLRRRVEPVTDLGALHPLLADLFRRCFVLGHGSPSARPSPSEWERALAEAVKSLAPCGKGHVYSSHLDACPECRRTPPVRRKPVPAARRASSAQRTNRPSPASAAGSGSRIPVRPTLAPARISISFPGWSPFTRSPLRRVQSWLRRRRRRGLVLQPGVWAAGGMLLGALLSTQLPGVTSGGILGLLGGLVSGALAGDVIEKKIGWEAFFGAFGALGGLLVWSWLGTSGAWTGWLAAAAIGGIFGMLIGRYGRFAELTLLWAASGAIGGWYFGQAAAGLLPVEWLAAALSGGLIGLLTGAAYALWRRYG